MCERHSTKVYLNKEQAHRDGTKVKIREMKALHILSVCTDYSCIGKRRLEFIEYPKAK